MTDYELSQIVSEIYSDAMWVRVSYPLLKVLSSDELVLLSYLINWYGMHREEDGSFFCKMEQIMQELYLSQTKQTRLIASLKEKGFIDYVMAGMPPKRWMRIIWRKLMEESSEIYKEVRDHRRKRKQKEKKNLLDEVRMRLMEEDTYARSNDDED